MATFKMKRNVCSTQEDSISQVTKKLLRPLAVVLLALVASPALSENPSLIVNDLEREGCELDGLSLIDPQTGDMRVNVVDIDNCLGAEGSAVVLSSIATSPDSVAPGGSFELIWASTSDEPCGLDAPGLSIDTSNIGTEGPTNVSVPLEASLGQQMMTIRCPGTGQALASKQGEIEVVSPESVPAQPELSVSASSITQGQSLTVTWQSEDADGCEVPSGITNPFPGWSGSKNTSGEQVLSTSASTGAAQYSVGLRCSNSAGAGPPAIQTVEVSEAENTDCPANRQPPAGMTRATSCQANQSGDCRFYDQIFGTFPGTTALRSFVLERDQYAAMAFTPGEVPFNARASINAEQLQVGGIPSGNLLYSISRCPGDFNKDAILAELDNNCVVQPLTGTGGIRFGGEGWTSGCTLSLPSDTTYFLNILYTNDSVDSTDPQNLSWMCGNDPSNSNCGHQMQPTSLSGWN